MVLDKFNCSRRAMKENFFTFDNIGGDYPLLGEELRRGAPTAVFGVSDSLKYLIASLVPYPVVYIAADGTAAQKAADNIAALSGKRTEVLAAKDEVLLYRKALSKDSLFKRLQGSKPCGGRPVVAAGARRAPSALPENTAENHIEGGRGHRFFFPSVPPDANGLCARF